MPFEKIKLRFPKIRENEPLKNHCTFRVGGSADLFYELSRPDDLEELIKAAQEEGIPYKVIGRGTNSLFTDKGFRGLIIKNLLNGVSVHGTRLHTGSGILLSELIRISVRENLTGLEPLYGVPGSVGAAIWGNAGVPAATFNSFLKRIEVLVPGKGRCTLGIDEAKKKELFAYRHTVFQEDATIILGAEIELEHGNREKSEMLLKEIDAARRAKQPIGLCAGSFFKNPSPDKAAGMLIEKAGLKGHTLGGAQISEKHANFFMNTGTATATELFELGRLAQKKVKELFGIDLEMEVKIIGDL